jgi:hypothetical protein
MKRAGSVVSAKEQIRVRQNHRFFLSSFLVNFRNASTSRSSASSVSRARSIPVRSPIGRALTTNGFRFLPGAEACKPRRIAVFRTSLKL